MRPFATLSLMVLLALAPPARADELKAEAKARITNLEQHLEDWNLPAARQELSELKKLVPSEVEPLAYFEGRLAFEEGRYPEAVEKLEKAGLEDKPGSYLRLAKDTLALTEGHQKAESEHFIFLYPKGKDEVLAPYALETLEKAYRALGEDLDYRPPGKVRVEVVNDARELAKVSTLTYEQIKTTGTIAICKFSKLMVTSPKAVLRGYDWQDTLVHEYIHLLVSQKSHNTVPIWLHEGLAKYLESRWRGKPGLAMTPSTLALLGHRVKQDKLIPFEKMHPSIALLPSAEDAATAFAEVFFAIDLIHREKGPSGLRTVIDTLASGGTDKAAVEKATGKSFKGFEQAWLSHVKRQDFPTELTWEHGEEIVLKEEAPGRSAKDEASKKKKDVSFGDFAEVKEPEARKAAHLGEVMRERGRNVAAAELYARAWKLVGDRYDSISNKYARALTELSRFDEAEQVLQGSLRLHPGLPATYVQLGRIRLTRKDWAGAKSAFLEALATDPFDPEVHLALLRLSAADALNDAPLAERARKAAVVLTGLSAEKIDTLAR